MNKIELIDQNIGVTAGNRFGIEISDSKAVVGITSPQGVLMVNLNDAQLEALAKFLNVKIHNVAIDKCIEVANKYDSYGPAYEMRMLKK